MDDYKVTRCICSEMTFEKLKDICIQNGYKNITEVIKNDLCGTNCEICHPYIKNMLQTGEVIFEEEYDY